MFAAIIGIWGGIPGPIRKILAYAGIAVIALWALKVFYLNPYANRIEADTRIKVSEEMRKQAEAKFKIQLEELQTQRQDLENKVATVEAANKELARSREAMVGSFNKTLSHIKEIKDASSHQDALVPDYMLDGRLRDVSNALECSRPGNIDRIGCPSSSANIPGKTPNP